ncbi:hypothetical protein T439DRAFT_19965 [Meredithblackwellia eburnea MCA 4105]
MFEYTGGPTLESYEWLFNLNNSSSNSGLSESGDSVGVSTGAAGMGALGGLGLGEVDWNQLALMDEGEALDGPEDPGNRLSFETSEKLQEIIWSLIPTPPNPSYTSHPYLQTYLSLYFRHFDPQTHYIHLPTFDPQQTEPYLLLAMCAIGAFYSDDDAKCQLFQRVVQRLAGLVVVSEGFVPGATNQTLLTTILVEIHGKTMNSFDEHSMRAIIHPAFINLALRTQIFEPKQYLPDDPSDPDSVWRAAVQEETSKRLAYAFFMMDIQHTTIFLHPASLSAFQVRLSLPWDEGEWAAPSAEAWQEFRTKPTYIPPSTFSVALKACINPSNSSTNPPSLVSSIALCGLLSIIADLKQKDLVILGVDGVGGEAAGVWKRRVSKALESWKTKHEAACLTKYGPRALWNNLSLQCIGRMSLSTEFRDIQIIAGWRVIMGYRVTRAAYEHARLNIAEWVKRRQGCEAAWHAINLLRAFILQRIDMGEKSAELADIPHLSWCLYMCTITCWVYGAMHLPALPAAEHFELPVAPVQSERILERDDYLQNALAYVQGMTARTPDELDLLSVAAKSNTNGLVSFHIRENLNPRWSYGVECSKRMRYLLRP